jgi:hypothetical protein
MFLIGSAVRNESAPRISFRGALGLNHSFPGTPRYRALSSAATIRSWPDYFSREGSVVLRFQKPARERRRRMATNPAKANAKLPRIEVESGTLLLSGKALPYCK